MFHADDGLFDPKDPIKQLEEVGKFITENAEEIIGDYEQLVITEGGFRISVYGVGEHDRIPTFEVCKTLFPITRDND